MHVGNKIKNMESKFKYTNERNVQIVIALLKAHGIHRVIASPGTTNMPLWLVSKMTHGFRYGHR